MSLPDIEAYIDLKIPVATIDPRVLLPLPPRRAPRVEGADGEHAVSVVEDAVSAAAAERKRRREREQRDGGGRRPGGAAGRVNAPRGRSDGRRSEGGQRPERPREERPAEQPRREPVAIATPRDTAAVADGEGARKRRRRSRRPRSEAAPVAAQAQQEAVGVPANGSPPKLRTRLKQKLKSWLQGLRGARH